MSIQNFKPFQYISMAFNAGMKRKAQRSAKISGNANHQMSLFEHIQELRKHVVRALFCLVIATAIAFLFMHSIIDYLKIPYDQFIRFTKGHTGVTDLTSIGVFEVMTVNFKLCFLVGFAIGMPFMVLELWKFVSPALYENEKKMARVFVFFSIVLFYCGLCFGYYLIIPYFFQSALSWASQYATVMITYESYFNSLVTLLLIFAIIFEVPVVLSLLGLSGILPSETLAKNRRVAFLACFMIGAILAPPDVLSLCLVALPMYFMVEVSIYIIRRIEGKKQLGKI